MTQSTEQERKLFEAFASDNGKWPQAIERDAKGNYLLLTTANGWMWWQAARQAAQVEVAELKGRIARAGIEQRRAVLEEREACAKACEGMEANRDWVPGSLWGNIRGEMAAAIRARRVPEQPALLQSHEMMDEIINMAGKVAICSSGDHKEFDHDGLFRFVAMVQAKERDECAQIVERKAAACDNHAMLRDVLMSNAAAIRARGVE